jgi:hypothetical protein
MSNIKESTPLHIVGVYLTDLDLIMVRVKMSDNSFVNYRLCDLDNVLPENLKNVKRETSSWWFVPCGE